MSDRERWIIYPIVFLTLALGLNNYIHHGTDAAFNVLECNSLLIRSADGDAKIHISGIGQTGHIRLYGSDGTSVVTLGAVDNGRSGQILLEGEKGSSVVMTASKSGSSTQLKTSNLDPEVVLGYSSIDKKYGLAAYDDGAPCVAITNDFGIVFYTRDGIREEIRRSMKEFDADQEAQAVHEPPSSEKNQATEPNDDDAPTNNENQTSGHDSTRRHEEATGEDSPDEPSSTRFRDADPEPSAADDDTKNDGLPTNSDDGDGK